jgi:hypothetical protein
MKTQELSDALLVVVVYDAMVAVGSIRGDGSSDYSLAPHSQRAATRPISGGGILGTP